VGVKAFGCVNNTIRVRSGRYFDLADPRPDQFTFADIAGALSKICRFGGQCGEFYSVAEHLWHCARQGQADGLPLDTQAALLLHDATEAFCGDVVKPLKIMLPGYVEIERRIEAVIAEKFRVDFERESASVEKIDREMLIAERLALFSTDNILWTGQNEVRRLSVKFARWYPATAEAAFARLAREIGIDVEG
jgi:hypothetical protein